MLYHVCESKCCQKKDKPRSGCVCRLRPFALTSFVVVLAWAGFMTYQTSLLEPPTKQEQWFAARGVVCADAPPDRSGAGDAL